MKTKTRKHCLMTRTDRGSQQNVTPRIVTTEDLFRGFAKLPCVVTEPIDVGPYLERPSTLAKANGLRKMGPKRKIIYTKGFGNSCYVKLFRDDLEHLKAKMKGLAPLEPYISCRICKKQYCEEKKLRLHLKSKHMIVYDEKPKKRVSFSDKVVIHEVTEYHKCRKCTKTFTSYDLLRVHMRKDHKKRKCYICNYCQKSFVDRSIFKVHIKLHCDNCSQLFPRKTLYNIHRKEVCQIFKTYKCRSCHRGFWSYLDRTEHMYDHADTEVFICDHCKERFEKKPELEKHMTANHKLLQLGKVTEDIVKPPYVNMNKENFAESAISKLKAALQKPLDNQPCESTENFTSFKDLLKQSWEHNLPPTLSNDNSKEVPKFNVKEKLPLEFQPKIILERLDNKLKDLPTNKVAAGKVMKENDAKIEEDSDEVFLVEGTQKNNCWGAVIDAKSKKTLLSKFQCQLCDRYLSCSSNLRRHMKQVHEMINDELFCFTCEETFVWPSLLLSHNCIRRNVPEMPFDDARPEILLQSPEVFENCSAGYENRNDSGDFEIPAPIVELTEYETDYVPVDYANNKELLHSLSYAVVGQEVPVEFCG